MCIRDRIIEPKKVETPTPTPTTPEEPVNPDEEKLLDKEELRALTVGAVFSTLTAKQSLHAANKEKVSVCEVEESTFNKVTCLALLSSLIRTTENIDLITNDILTRTDTTDEERKEIKEIALENYNTLEEYKVKLQEVSALE